MSIRTAALGASFTLSFTLAACFHGFDVEDKEPPPGYAGGVCNFGSCVDGSMCLVDEDVCVDPINPCKGIYCGGRGDCSVDLDSNLPFCICDPGYTAEPYAYFCIPIGL